MGKIHKVAIYKKKIRMEKQKALNSMVIRNKQRKTTMKSYFIPLSRQNFKSTNTKVKIWNNGNSNGLLA